MQFRKKLLNAHFVTIYSIQLGKNINEILNLINCHFRNLTFNFVILVF